MRVIDAQQQLVVGLDNADVKRKQCSVCGHNVACCYDQITVVVV